MEFGSNTVWNVRFDLIFTNKITGKIKFSRSRFACHVNIYFDEVSVCSLHFYHHGVSKMRPSVHSLFFLQIPPRDLVSQVRCRPQMLVTWSSDRSGPCVWSGDQLAKWTPDWTGGNLVSVQVGHDDVIKWKHFPRYWPFARGIHRCDSELWCFLWSAPESTVD